MFLSFKAMTTKDISTYTHLSTPNDSKSTVQLATDRSTLSNSEHSFDSPTATTKMTKSMIYSSIYTTEQSATSRKSTIKYIGQSQFTNEDREISKQTTREPITSTSTLSIRQSSTLSTTNGKSGTSLQGTRILQ